MCLADGDVKPCTYCLGPSSPGSELGGAGDGEIGSIIFPPLLLHCCGFIIHQERSSVLPSLSICLFSAIRLLSQDLKSIYAGSSSPTSWLVMHNTVRIPQHFFPQVSAYLFHREISGLRCHTGVSTKCRMNCKISQRSAHALCKVQKLVVVPAFELTCLRAELSRELVLQFK